MSGKLGSSFGINTSRGNRALFSSQWPLDIHMVQLPIMLGNIHNLSLIQGFEVEMYLRAVQSDVQQKKSCCSLHIATNVLWPEV